MLECSRLNTTTVEYCPGQARLSTKTVFECLQRFEVSSSDVIICRTQRKKSLRIFEKREELKND